MATIASDGFSGSDGSSISGRTMDAAFGGSGNSWVLDSGTAVLASNQLSQTSGGSVVAHDGSMSALADMEVTIKAVLSLVGSIARFVDGSNYYLAFRSTAGASRLYKNVAGSLTQLGSDGTASSVNDTVTCRCVGNQISMLVNGSVVVGPITDATFASGKAGLFSFTAGAIDDYKCFSIVSNSSLLINGGLIDRSGGLIG